MSGHEGVVNCVKFNEANVLTGSSDNTARFWDMSTGIQTSVFRTTAPVCALCYTDHQMFMGSTNGLVKQWDCKTGVCEHIITHSTTPIKGIWATDKDVYVIAEDNVHIYDIRTNEVRQRIPQPCKAFYVDSTKNELVLAAGKGTVDVWDTSIGVVKRSYRTESRAELTTLACDGDRVVAGDEEGCVTVWNTTTTERIHSLKDHRGRINALQMDGRKLVTASADNTIKVWNLAAGSRLYSLLGGSLQVRANVPFVLSHLLMLFVCFLYCVFFSAYTVNILHYVVLALCISMRVVLSLALRTWFVCMTSKSFPTPR